MHFLKTYTAYIKDPPKGFTLIEVLAALALFTLVTLLGMTLLLGAQGSQRSIESGFSLQKGTNQMVMDMRKQFNEQTADANADAPIVVAINVPERIEITELLVNGEDQTGETVIRDITAGDPLRIDLTTRVIPQANSSEQNADEYKNMTVNTVFNGNVKSNTFNVAMTPVENFIWEYTDETEETVRITDYIGEDVHIGIPETIKDKPVTEFGTYAFGQVDPVKLELDNSRPLIESVKLPNTITSIGSGSFAFTGLKTIEFPESVTTIENSAFYESELEHVTIPETLTSIETSAFSGNNIKTIDLHDGITSIGTFAFSDNQLTHAPIPKGISTIGSGMYANNKLSTVTIPAHIKVIGANAFQTNQITSINIPETVEEVDLGAFGLNQFGDIFIRGKDTVVTGAGSSRIKDNPDFTVHALKDSKAKTHLDKTKSKYITIKLID